MGQASSKKSARRLIASARQQPELALRFQQQLPEATRELFLAAISVPGGADEPATEHRPGLKKCSFAKSAYSAQLECFAKSLRRSG